MTTTAERTEVPRDGYGRPLVIPPGGGKATAYQRATTFAGLIDDTYNLARWQQRMVALGLVQRPDLSLSVAAHKDDKNKLNDLCEQAREAAGGSTSSTTGTALHTFTERLDRGESLGALLTEIPKQYEADLRSYYEVTRDLIPLHIERLVVVDDLKVAGTPDRVVVYKGEPFIADLKTGGIQYAAGKIAIQLALYAHGSLYETSGVRTPLDVNTERAIVVHLPAAEGAATLHWVDIEAGWEAAQVCAQVRSFRQKKSLLRPIVTS